MLTLATTANISVTAQAQAHTPRLDLGTVLYSQGSVCNFGQLDMSTFQPCCAVAWVVGDHEEIASCGLAGWVVVG